MHHQAKARHPNYIESELQRVWQASQKDGDKLSPVDLAIEDAHPVHLAPLSWTDYRQTPTSMTVTNSGFTVMVNASFGGGRTPRVSRGPLQAEYVFSQIHFHWGEHDRTGSGHAVKGVRYPLEMHVVHLKKDCANLKEALKSKDGIVVMVYLFALREERNTQLDQLTAILQFIQRARACARLHPTALAELVPPFSSNYFLYWGAVGTPSGRCRILWMVSRNVLPVSTQQLCEFRQLYDSQGKLLVSNSSKPHPLGERTLFLVSPLEETRETMNGIVGGMTGQREDSDDNSIDIRDAEYKSFGNLEQVVNENCRICPAQERLQNVTRINVEYPYRVNEGDTSIEESCVDLSNGTDDDPGVTVKTETKTNPGGRRVTNVTNVNVTTCRHRYRARTAPSEEVYAVVSARGSELHLRRKPGATVRQHERSVEQACMLLSATRSSSAPSLTCRGLATTQEHTDLSGVPAAPTKLSSEVAVHRRHSEIERPPRPHYRKEYDEYEDESYEEKFRSSKRARRVTVVNNDSKNSTNDRPVEIERISISQMPIQQNNRLLDKQLDERDQYESEDKKRSQYFLVKQIQDKKPFYKVIGELPKRYNKSESTSKGIPETKRNYSVGNDITKKTGEDPTILQNQGESIYSEFQKDQSYDEKEHRKITHKQVISNIPQTVMLESMKGEEEINNTMDYRETRKRQDPKPEINITTESDPHYKVSLMVRTTVSDHRKPGKKPRGSAQKYYVTKISPKDKPIFVTPKSSDSKIEKCYGKVNEEQYYYANPILERETTELNVQNESSHSKATNEAYMSEYEETIEESHNKQFREEQYFTTADQETINTENERTPPSQTLKSDSNGRQKLQNQSIYNINSYNQGIIEDKRVESRRESAVKHVSQKYSSSEVNDPRKHSNLVERTNVYHGKNPPDEDIRMVNKIITGTVGKSDSTEVFVQDKHVEVVNPRKTDVSKEVNYNLVTSKHPEPQYYVKEPQNKSGPRAVVRQHLSLDQQIQGQSQVRQTVEYHDNDRPNANGHPSKRQEISKSDRSYINMTGATYRQSNHEIISTTRKTQHAYKSMMQGESRGPKYIQNDYNENDNRTMHNEKDELIRQSGVDQKSALPKVHTTSTSDFTSNLQKGGVYHTTKDMSQVNKIDIPKRTDIIEDNTIMKQQLRDSTNAGMSSYEYDETNSLTENFESSIVKKKLQYVEPLPYIPDRIEGDTVKKQNNLHDILHPKPPERIISDKRPRVSFQNDNNQNIYGGIEYEETTEEDSLYTSRRMKGKKITSQIRGKSPYKVPEQTQPQLRAPSDHTLKINKVEIPEPHYITRVPKQPLVEFEAYPVDPHEPFQIISESQEMSSTVKTQKTFMMFKKINGKAVLNQPSVIEPIKIKSNRNEQSRNDQSVIEQDRSNNHNQFRNDEMRNELSRNQPFRSDQYVHGQLKNDQSRLDEQYENEQHRLSDSNPKSVIPMSRSQTVPILSVNAPNQVFIEEIDEENNTHDKQSQSVRRKQIRGVIPLEVNKKTPKTNSEQEYNYQPNTDEEIEVKRNKAPTGKKEPQAVIMKQNNIPPALPRDPEKRIFAEYEYSETSLLSQQKIIRKQKRYMYNVEQPPLFEEPTPSIFDNNRQAIDDDFSTRTSKQKTNTGPQQEEELPTVMSQNGSAQDRRIVQDTPPRNINQESDPAYENENHYIDQEYYGSKINKNKTYKSSGRKFESNQRREMDPVQTIPEPSNLLQLQPQDHGIVQDASSRNRNNKKTETDTDLNKPDPSQLMTHKSQDHRDVQHTPTQNRNIESDNAYQKANLHIDQEYYEHSTDKTYKSSKRQFESNQRRDMEPVPTQPGPSHLMQLQSQDQRGVQDTSSRNRNNQRAETDTNSNNIDPSQVVTDTSQDNRDVKHTPSQNRDIESNNAYQNANLYIDQEYYEHSSNKNKTYKSSKRQFESNQRRDMNPVPTQPEPSHLMQLQTQDQRGVQDTSSRNRNNQRAETDTDSNNLDPSQVVTYKSQDNRDVQDNPSPNRNIERNNAYQNANLYIDQEYYDSATNKNKSYKSSKRQFTSNKRTELDPQLSQPGPSHLMPLPSMSQNRHIFLKDEDLQDKDEPTKDTIMSSGTRASTNRSGRVSEFSTSNQKSHTGQSYGAQVRGQSFQGDKSNALLVKSLGTAVPSTKTDGDIVIYIRQPRVRKEHVVPKITVDVTDKHKVSPSKINQQTVEIQELKPKRTNTGKRRITPRKSKSEKMYRPSNSSESSSAEDMETSLQTESNEEQVLDTTHYNLTLKSQTKVDISKSEKANVTSTAKVRITPLSSGPQIDLEESCSDVKMSEARDTTSYETSSADAGGNACDARHAYQSPIKIDSVAAVTRQCPRLQFHNHWNTEGEALLENNGKTLRASLPDFKDEDLPQIEGGPLVGRYHFVELHFHWGWKDCCGAEHVIDGHRHALEAHFLYVKNDYESLETGMQYADGLATVAVKFDVGGPPHPGLGELIKDMRLIREADTGVYVPVASLFTWLRPAMDTARGYFSYKGMLTKNPPCVDCVTWLIFPQPIVFCCQQSSEFRKLKSSTGEELRKNFRTPQPLNNRPVYYVPIVT